MEPPDRGRVYRLGFRHLMPPPFDPDTGNYGYNYWASKAGSHSIGSSPAELQARWDNDYFKVSDGGTDFGILNNSGWLKRMWDQGNGSTRASITDIETGETRVFVDVDGLCRWLRGIHRTDAVAAKSTSSPETPVDLT